MPARVILSDHLPLAELEHRYRTCRDPGERSRWHMLWLVGQGHSAAAVARLTGYSDVWVRIIVHRYNAHGPDAVIDGRRTNPGQAPLVPPATRAALREALAAPPPDGGVWTGPKAAAWLSERLDRDISPQRAWEVLRAVGFTLQRPRPRAAQADPAAQTAFKRGAR
jgi:transposase